MIRAKFRVLEVKTRLEVVSVGMKPVIAKSDSYPGGSEENAKFWKATPTGDAVFWYGPEAEIPSIGSYWYLDCEEDVEGEWTLCAVAARESTREPHLVTSAHRSDRPMRNGEVKMDIANRDAWSSFDLERVGRRWSVRLTEAPAPAAGLASYP